MDLNQIEQFCGSPIEAAMAREIAAKFKDFEWAGFRLVALPPTEYRPLIELPKEGQAFLIPQATITGCDEVEDWQYRVDFLLMCGRRASFRRLYAIECDGHEWHEKTKEQVARDKLRDRRMIMDGITPIRFSGSEVYASVEACVWYVRGLANWSLGDSLHRQHEWEELRKLRAPKAGDTGGEG